MTDDKSQMTNSPSFAKATEAKLQKGLPASVREALRAGRRERKERQDS